MGIKSVIVFVLTTAMFMFFFWWGGINFLERSFNAAYLGFCCVVFGALCAWWANEVL